MTNSYERLLTEIDRLIALLDHYDVDGWSGWFRQARAEIAAGDLSGLRRVRRAYGGMGSFNDLVLHPSNGDALDEHAIGPANEELVRRSMAVREIVEAIEVGRRRKPDSGP